MALLPFGGIFSVLDGPFPCPNSPPAEYDYCPESVLLPLRDRLFSLCLNGPGQRTPMILPPDTPPFPCEQLGGGELRRGCLHGDGLVIDSQSGSREPWQAGNPRPMTCGARCLCVSGVCERMSGWMNLWHTVRWQDEAGIRMSNCWRCLVWRNAKHLVWRLALQRWINYACSEEN